MVKLRRIFAFAGILLISHSAASALTINATFSDTAGETWTATRQGVVNQAIADWEAVFVNVNETVDVTFDFTKVGTGSYLGQWSGGISVSYYTEEPTPVRPWDTSTMIGDPTYTGASIDASHTIHTNADFFTHTTPLWFDPSPTEDSDLVSGVYDALSMIRHEIGHMMGFAALYKDDYFSAPENWASQITGTTFDSGGLNLEVAGLGNLNHFANSGSTSGDLMVPALLNGVRRDISDNDIASLEVAYGYNLVPEPATMGILAFGGLSLLYRRRRRS